MKKTKSIRVRMLEIFILLIIFTVIAVILNFFLSSRRTAFQLSDSIATRVSENVIQRTADYLSAPAKQTIAISTVPENTEDIMQNYEASWRYMWQQLLIQEQVQAFFLGDKNGNYVQVRREPRLATRYIDRSTPIPEEQWFYRDEDYNIVSSDEFTAKFDPRIRPWYKNTKAEKKIYWTDVYVFTTAQTPGISATYPLVNASGDLTAVAAANIPLHSLSAFLKEQTTTENGIVFIAHESKSPDGSVSTNLIAYPDASRVTTKKVLSDGREVVELTPIGQLGIPSIDAAVEYYRKTGKNSFSLNLNWKSYLVNVVPFPMDFTSGWEMYIILPESDTLGDSLRSLFGAIGIAAAILAGSIVAVYYTSRSISASIFSLAEMTREIKDFNLDRFVGVESNIEEVSIMNDSILAATHGLKAFQKYVPSDLVRQLIGVEGAIGVGGKEEVLTILFTDVENFTTLSESMRPGMLMHHLSDYLEALVDIIQKDGGTIDKFIGDSIMAFWGAPKPVAQPAYQACASALKCQRVLNQLNAMWAEEGRPIMKTRFGIHTGETVVGNIGSETRLNYTVIGDSVNLASRLEGANKDYGTSIIISENTHNIIADDFVCRMLDVITVKGKKIRTRIFELLGFRDDPIPENVKTFCKYYEAGIQCYLDQKWDAALKIFESLAEKFPSETSVAFLRRKCEYSKKNG